MDDDGNRTISFPEFKKGIRDYGLQIDAAAVQSMFEQFDKDSSHTIDFDEFLMALRVSIGY